MYDGKLVLAGLTTPVTVDYGPHAVPSLRADTLEDLLFAQGFVTASERMWQMDLLRRVASGRLAEVFGEHALPLDRLMRTLGLGRAAEPLPTGLEEIRAGIANPFAAADGVSAALGLPRPGPASNAWALAASRTADG